MNKFFRNTGIGTLIIGAVVYSWVALQRMRMDDGEIFRQVVTDLTQGEIDESNWYTYSQILQHIDRFGGQPEEIDEGIGLYEITFWGKLTNGMTYNVRLPFQPSRSGVQGFSAVPLDANPAKGDNYLNELVHKDLSVGGQHHFASMLWQKLIFSVPYISSKAIELNTSAYFQEGNYYCRVVLQRFIIDSENRTFLSRQFVSLVDENGQAIFHYLRGKDDMGVEFERLSVPGLLESPIDIQEFTEEDMNLVAEIESRCFDNLNLPRLNEGS